MKLRDYTGNRKFTDCTRLELFNALLRYVADAAKARGYNEGRKKVYYISAEFLIGKLLSNNLINLGLYGEVRDELAAEGIALSELEEFELEPSLGNGGLGRLAACFLDSLATLGLPADGLGLAYHCGLFRQSFVDRQQTEAPDHWLKWGQESWMRRTDVHYDIPFGDFTARSTLYEIDVTGYQGKCGRLRLFDVDTADERLIKSGIGFDARDVARGLTLFLYPDDSTEQGRLLRVYQEYFMVANAARLILEECVARGSDLHDLADYAAIQINDTHPTLVIPELIRLLQERGIGEDEAVSIVRSVCAYTNHTILAEALEKWPRAYLEKVAPQLMPVIDRLDARVRAKYDDPFVQIIDEQGNVRMANLDIHFTHSVNGVAKLHTEILKNSELAPFYAIYPEKFNNKTNGITHRRWLIGANNELAHVIDDKLTRAWRGDTKLMKQLNQYVDNPAFLKSIDKVKRARKRALAQYVLTHNKVRIKVDSMFDVQVKRIHSYKRQLMNIMHIMYQYDRLKNDPTYNMPVPVVYFFGGKAAPGYFIAKETIRLILAVANKINTDPSIDGKIKVVFLENFGVSLGEMVYPAADVSEQISTASKEASGTGNMKFMMNGAITLGTMDGANVEIHEQVGDDNCVIFGMRSEEVINLYEHGGYSAWDEYNTNANVRKVMNQMTDGTYGNFQSLFDYLVNSNDEFFIMKDFNAYIEAHEEIVRRYQDHNAWLRSCAVNIANSGIFSSDRTIAEYAENIWNINPVDIK